jgi:pilus retraction protein PilT
MLSASRWASWAAATWTFAYSPNYGRFRASVVQQRLGIDMAFRIINTQIRSIEELGLPDTVRTLTRYHNGLVLVTGPVGCGKSTTLAALVDSINKERQDHIITLEDPIEYVVESKGCHVNQREVHTHTASFAAALRGALREDPDVIMVGEMRDLETISLAITAAETGHLVLGTSTPAMPREPWTACSTCSPPTSAIRSASWCLNPCAASSPSSSSPASTATAAPWRWNCW